MPWTGVGRPTVVGFRRAGLVPVATIGLLLALTGPAMMLVRWDLLGVAVPRAVAAVFGTGAVALGGWLLFLALERWRSADPAIRLLDGRLWLHVHPGRRMVLDRSQVRQVTGPRPVRGPQRWVLGHSCVRLATTRPEGIAASTVVIGAAFVETSTDEIARLLTVRAAR